MTCIRTRCRHGFLVAECAVFSRDEYDTIRCESPDEALVTAKVGELADQPSVRVSRCFFTRNKFGRGGSSLSVSKLQKQTGAGENSVHYSVLYDLSIVGTLPQLGFSTRQTKERCYVVTPVQGFLLYSAGEGQEKREQKPKHRCGTRARLRAPGNGGDRSCPVYPTGVP